jgi:catechol 2,3-dioxygenase-like lactoylglutathione lyase family enzyme
MGTMCALEESDHMIRHVSGIAEIVEDVESAVRFYHEVLGLVVEHTPGEDYAVVKVPGVMHFGIWSRKAAAARTFGDASMVDHVPLGFMLGLEVDQIDAAIDVLSHTGWNVVQTRQSEPWGQETTRFLAPSGALCELTETPWARTIEDFRREEPEAAGVAPAAAGASAGKVGEDSRTRLLLKTLVSFFHRAPGRRGATEEAEE